MCRFIKFIPSKEAMHLLRKHPKAFILLTFIAERARRINGEPDGLTIGQCQIGDYVTYGLTEKEYRTAKKILVDRGHIKIVETCRTRSKKINSKSTLNLQNSENRADERATRTTIHGTLAELCSTEVYDINSDDTNQQKGDRKGDRGATGGRPKGEEEEGRRKKKNEKEDHPSIPSSDSGLMIDDSLSEEKIEIISGVFMSKTQLDTCVQLKGDVEKVKIAVQYIQGHKNRKTTITDWPNALMKWKVGKNFDTTAQENLVYVEKLCTEFPEFKNGRGWRCYVHNDRIKDQKGILFECENPYQHALFIGLLDAELKQKCERFIEEKMMRKQTKPLLVN